MPARLTDRPPSRFLLMRLGRQRAEDYATDHEDDAYQELLKQVDPTGAMARAEKRRLDAHAKPWKS